MVKKDQSMLKKAIGKTDETSIVRTASCYVRAETGDIWYQDPKLFDTEEEERAEQLISFIKKGLGGKIGTNVIELVPEEKNLLEGIRKDELTDANVVQNLLSVISEAYHSDEDYGIFVTYGVYDLPATNSDGDYAEDVYSFVLVTIHPCGLSKSGIVYDVPENSYVDRKKDRPLGAPKHSFLWPALDNGIQDVSKAVYFSKNEKVQAEIHEVIENLFATTIPLSPQEQKAGFMEMMNASNDGTGISYDEVQRVYQRFSSLQAEADVSGTECKIDTDTLRDIIENDELMDDDAKEALEKAAEQYEGREFNLCNIAPRNIGIKTDNASMKVDLNELTELEVIEYGGRRCLLVPLYGAEVENMRVK